MNAYERRKYEREHKARQNYKKRVLEKQLNKAQAEKFYEEAFVALQGRLPKVIPKISTEALIYSANLMYARLHEQELGGDDAEV